MIIPCKTVRLKDDFSLAGGDFGFSSSMSSSLTLRQADGTSRSWEDAEELASQTLKKLSPWQRSKLVKGIGWQGWILKRGFFAPRLQKDLKWPEPSKAVEIVRSRTKQQMVKV